MAANLAGRDLVSMRDLSVADLGVILDTALLIKADRPRVRAAAPLAGHIMAMVFQKPSLRTRVAAEAAMTLLGGRTVHLAAADVRLGQREQVEDTALSLSLHVDVILARVFGQEMLEDLARHASVPVISGLSDLEHPTQVLADLMTLRERLGRTAGLRGTYIGDGNNVAHSWLHGAALAGVHLTVASPPGYEPLSRLVNDARAVAEQTGATLSVVNDPHASIAQADFVYTDVWASMGKEDQLEERRVRFKDYRIDAKLLRSAPASVLIMHCLPAHYGEEVEYQISRSPNAVIFQQAENHAYVLAALVLLLLGKSV